MIVLLALVRCCVRFRVLRARDVQNVSYSQYCNLASRSRSASRRPLWKPKLDMNCKPVDTPPIMKLSIDPGFWNFWLHRNKKRTYGCRSSRGELCVIGESQVWKWSVVEMICIERWLLHCLEAGPAIACPFLVLLKIELACSCVQHLLFHWLPRFQERKYIKPNAY